MRYLVGLALLICAVCIVGCGEKTFSSGSPPVMNTGKGAPPAYGAPGEGSKTEPPKGFKSPKAQ